MSLTPLTFEEARRLTLNAKVDAQARQRNLRQLIESAILSRKGIANVWVRCGLVRRMAPNQVNVLRKEFHVE